MASAPCPLRGRIDPSSGRAGAGACAARDAGLSGRLEMGAGGGGGKCGKRRGGITQ
jgi:hypothetical protein